MYHELRKRGTRPMNELPHIGQVLTLNAHVFPDKIGARDLDRALTFAQWNARACRLANALLGLGLAKGDRVAVLAYNCVEWLEIYAAAAKAGVIAVPINFRLVGAGDPLHRRRTARPRAFIVQDELAGARRGGARRAATSRRRTASMFGGAPRPPAGAPTRS